MMADEGVLAHLRANHDRILSKLVEFASIPSVSTDPAHAADIDRAARWVAAEVAAAGPFTVRTLPTAGNPVVYGEWLGAPGKPHGAGVRSLRRAAARSAREVAQPAVDADRARRPPLRPRRVRRQGADADSDRGGRGVLRDGRLPARQREVHVRGRGRDRQPPPRRLRAAAQGAPRGGRRRVGGRRDVAHRRAVAHRGEPRTLRARAHAHGGREGSALGPPRRRRGESAACDGRAHRLAARVQRPRGGGGVLRRGPRAVVRRARGACRIAVRRAGVPRAGRRAVRVRRARLHDARASVDAADARGQRHVGRLPGTWPEDRDPERGAREDHLPARAGSGSGRGGGAGGATSRGPRAAGHPPVAVARGPRLACGAHHGRITSR